MSNAPNEKQRWTDEEMRERLGLNRPYVWPIVGGQRARQGDCSLCRQIDGRHPEGRACDYSCVGV